MLLDEWLQANDMSIKQFERVVVNPRTGQTFSYTTLFRIAHLQPCDSYITAKAISQLSGGKVSIAELADPDVIAAALRARGQRNAAKKKATKTAQLPAASVSGATKPRKARRKFRRAPAAATSDHSPEAA